MYAVRMQTLWTVVKLLVVTMIIRKAYFQYKDTNFFLHAYNPTMRPVTHIYQAGSLRTVKAKSWENLTEMIQPHKRC
jgi:hypothetical protein